MLSGAASASSGPAPHGKRGGGHGGNAAPGGGGGRGSRPAPPGAASSSATEDRHDTTSVNGQEAGNGSRFKVGGWYEGVVKRYNPLRGYGFLTGQFVLAFDPADCENVCCSDVDEVLKNAHTAAPTPVVTGGKAENPPHHDASMATEGNVSFTHPASTATAPFTDEEGGDDASKGGHRGSVVPSTMQWYLYHLEEQGKLDHQAAPLGDIFVHHSCISMDGFRVLPIGAPVRFSVAVLMNTVQAVDVIPLGEEWMKRPSLTCELVFTQPTPPPFTISPTAATVLRYHILSKQEQEKRKHKAAASAASSGGGGDGAGENDDTASDGEGSASSSAVGDAVAYLSVTWNDMVVVPSPAIPNSLESRSELQAVPVHSLPKPTPPSVKTAVPSSASSTATGKRPRTSESVAPHRTLTEPPPSYKDLPPLPVDTTAPAGSVHSSMRGGAQNSSESNSTTAAGKPHTGSSAEGTTSSQQVGDGSSASPLFQMMMSGGKGSNSQPATGDEFSGGGLTNSANVNGSGGERGTTQTHITNSQNSPQGNSQGPNSQEMTATESSNKDREQQTVSSQETSGRGEVQGAGNAHVHKHTDANAENAATGGGAVEHKSHHHHRTNTGGGGGKGEAAAAAAAAAGEGRGEEHILTPASSNRRQHVSSDSSNQLGAGSDDEKDTTTTGSGTANSGSTLPETKFVNDDPSANWDDVFDRKIANERVKDVLLRKTDLRFFPYKAASGAAAAAAAAAAAIAAAGKEAASAVAVPEVVPLSAVGELDSSSSRGVENDGGSTDPTDTDHQPQTNSSGEGPTQISDEPRYEEQQRHKLEEVERKRAARRRSRSKERRDVAHATAHAAGENKTEEGTTASPPLVVVPVKDLPPAVASQVPPGVFFIALPQSVVSQLGIHVHPNGTPHTTPAADGAGAGSQRKLRSHRSSTEESRHGSAHSSPSQVQMNAMLAGYQSSASSASPSRRLPPGSQVSFPQLVPRSTVSSTSSHMPAIFPTLPRKPMNSVQLPIPPWLDPKPAGESEVTSLPMDTFDTDSSCTPTHTANSAGAFVFYPHRAASTSAHRRHHRRNDSTKGAGCHHNPIPLGTRGPLGEDWQASDSARGDSYHSAAEGFDRAPGGSGDGTTSSRSWQSPQSFMAPGGVFTDEVASSPERQSQSVQSPSSPSRHEGQPGGPGKAPGPSSPGATGGLMTSGYNMWQS